MSFPLMPNSGDYSIYATPTVTYVAQYRSSSNTYTYTFSASAIGTAAADRLVVVCAMINASDSGSSYGISSITIGGVAATIAVEAAGGKNSTIGYRLVTTGTTADIVVTLTGTGTPGRCVVNIFNVNGWSSQTPAATSSNTSSGAVSSLSTSAPASTGACAISCCFTYAEITHTWGSPFTEVADQITEDSSTTAAYAQGLSVGTLTATVTNSAAAESNMSLAVWE